MTTHPSIQAARPKGVEKPILFSGPMVKAILDGKKTQTRRVIGGNWTDAFPAMPGGVAGVYRAHDRTFTGSYLRCPYGAPGDRLWVRETWCETDGDPAHDDRIHADLSEAGYRCAAYRADDWIDCPADDGRWRPSIHMPRWASRLSLDVLDVRVERLQAITEADAQAEGAELTGDDEAQDGAPDAGRAESYRAGFATLWDSINGHREGCAWRDDPWIWRIAFRYRDGLGNECRAC